MKTTEELTKILYALGGKSWEKNGMRRIYMPTTAIYDFIQLKVSYYNTGNVSHATLAGESISNSEAKRMLANTPKVYYDLNNWMLVVDSKKVDPAYARMADGYYQYLADQMADEDLEVIVENAKQALASWENGDDIEWQEYAKKVMEYRPVEFPDNVKVVTYYNRFSKAWVTQTYQRVDNVDTQLAIEFSATKEGGILSHCRAVVNTYEQVAEGKVN